MWNRSDVGVTAGPAEPLPGVTCMFCLERARDVAEDTPGQPEMIEFFKSCGHLPGCPELEEEAKREQATKEAGALLVTLAPNGVHVIQATRLAAFDIDFDGAQVNMVLEFAKLPTGAPALIFTVAKKSAIVLNPNSKAKAGTVFVVELPVVIAMVGEAFAAYQDRNQGD